MKKLKSKTYLLFLLTKAKDCLELKHGLRRRSDEHQPPDRFGDELPSQPKVPTRWPGPHQSSGVQPVATVPPRRQPAAHEGRPGFLAQHHDG